MSSILIAKERNTAALSQCLTDIREHEETMLMESNKEMQARFGAKLIEELNIDYQELASDEKIDLKVKEIVEHLSVTYYGGKEDPDYDTRVTN